MKMHMNVKADCSEPMYDDCTLELIKNQEIEDLITALVEYCNGLEKQVVDLRCQVNRLTPSGKREPFPDPKSDLYEVFYHYAAYPRFRKILKRLD